MQTQHKTNFLTPSFHLHVTFTVKTRQNGEIHMRHILLFIRTGLITGESNAKLLIPNTPWSRQVLVKRKGETINLHQHIIIINCYVIISSVVNSKLSCVCYHFKTRLYIFEKVHYLIRPISYPKYNVIKLYLNLLAIVPLLPL